MTTLLAAASGGTPAEQAVQVAGALLVLSGFVLAQRGRLAPDSPRYLWLNLTGSAALAVLAASGSDWGFLLLEGAWAIVSGWSLLSRLTS